MTTHMIYWQPGDVPLPMLFPPSWQARLDRHTHSEKRIQAQFAYVLLASVLLEHETVLPELDATSTGKPYFPQCLDLHFSVSHTSGAAMVAVGESPVGVDIERIRPVSVHMMARVAQTTEIKTFFETWVTNEAVGKCTGTGISALGTVVVPTDVSHQVITANPGYCAAVATQKKSDID